MLRYPLNGLLHALPLVVLDGELYAATHGGGAGAALIMPSGAEYPLRRLANRRVLAEHAVRTNRPALEEIYRQHLAWRTDAQPSDAVRYFTEWAGRAWDWLKPPAMETRGHPERAVADVDGILDGVPGPRLPSPALCLLGRFWSLREADGGGVRVRFRDSLLSMTGDCRAVAELGGAWAACVSEYLSGAAARAASAAEEEDEDEELRAARRKFAGEQVLQSGDLVLIGGETTWLAHVLREHYNRSLHMEVKRNVAIAARLRSPAAIPPDSELAVYGLSAGKWTPVRRLRGVCLGRGERPTNLAPFLRWAANRIADNGLFHEHDDGEDD